MVLQICVATLRVLESFNDTRRDNRILNRLVDLFLQVLRQVGVIANRVRDIYEFLWKIDSLKYHPRSRMGKHEPCASL